ncbi:MAG: xylulokinase [bacterium]
MDRVLLVGVDVGTTEAKAGLFADDGQMVSSSRHRYPILTPGLESAAEGDPLTWWRAVKRALRDIVRGAPPGEIAAISVGGQGPTLVAVDGDIRPVRNAILWMDGRAKAEAEFISRGRSGRDIGLSWFVPNAMWIKSHEPEVYGRVRWFLQCPDYISSLLTREVVASFCSDHFRLWTDELISLAGLPSSLFPPSVLMGEVIGKLSPDAADATGLPPGIPVVAGGVDFVEALIGTNALERGIVCDRGGTSQGINLCWDSELRDERLFCVPHPVRQGYWHIGGMMSTTGGSLEWCRESLYGGSLTYLELMDVARMSPPGAGGLVFLPYLMGERTPVWDSSARGVFFGLSLNHTRGDIVRAILEGVAYGIAQTLDIMRALGGEPSEVRATGGQAQSDLWNQIKADATGLPVLVPEIPDSEIFGAAIIAGVGVGLLSDIVTAAGKMVRMRKSFEPNPENEAIYRKMREVYEGLYPALRDSFQRLSQIWGIRRGQVH